MKIFKNTSYIMRCMRFLFSCVIPWPMLHLSLGAWSPTTAYPLKKLSGVQRLPVSDLDATMEA